MAWHPLARQRQTGSRQQAFLQRGFAEFRMHLGDPRTRGRIQMRLELLDDFFRGFTTTILQAQCEAHA